MYKFWLIIAIMWVKLITKPTKTNFSTTDSKKIPKMPYLTNRWGFVQSSVFLIYRINTHQKRPTLTYLQWNMKIRTDWMAKVTYKMCWLVAILNQCRYEELSVLLEERPTVHVWQVYAFYEMTKEAVWKSTKAKQC